jgi:uncharacterized membrane protein
MKPIEFSVSIDRPLDEVYKYATDLNRLPEWGKGVIDCEIITDGPLEVGSIFIVKNDKGGRGQKFESKVITIEPNSEFSFQTGSGALGYTSNRTFEKKDGKTFITERISPEISGLMKLATPLLRRFVRNSHYHSLLKLKEILER